MVRWLGLGVVVLGAVGGAWYLQRPLATPTPARVAELSAPANPLPSPVTPTMAAPGDQVSAPPPAAAAPRTRAARLKPAAAVKDALVVAPSVPERVVPRAEPTTADVSKLNVAAKSTPARSGIAPSADSAKPAEPAATDTLMLELPLLRDAQAALNQNRAEEALTRLERHTMRYPKGVLRQERIAAQVSALCMLGRIPEATQLAQQLARIAPSSPHLAKLENSCVNGIDPRPSIHR